MGLDMWLVGRKTLFHDGHLEDGFPVTEIRVGIAYWRKYYPLHTHMMGLDAVGYLPKPMLERILADLQADKELHQDRQGPEAEYYVKCRRDAVVAFKLALAWVAKQEKYERRDVLYESSS